MYCRETLTRTEMPLFPVSTDMHSLRLNADSRTREGDIVKIAR